MSLQLESPFKRYYLPDGLNDLPEKYKYKAVNEWYAEVRKLCDQISHEFKHFKCEKEKENMAIHLTIRSIDGVYNHLLLSEYHSSLINFSVTFDLVNLVESEYLLYEAQQELTLIAERVARIEPRLWTTNWINRQNEEKMKDDKE